MKVVYYGNYLTYFEVGRVEYLRQQGLAMSEIDRKVHMPVVEATVRYVKPAHLDDLIEVRCWISEKKRASFRFSYDIRDERAERIAHGFTLHACQDPASARLVGIPAWLGDVMIVVARET
jgi:acyl-CoA thioester hydrolase